MNSLAAYPPIRPIKSRYAKFTAAAQQRLPLIHMQSIWTAYQDHLMDLFYVYVAVVSA